MHIMEQNATGSIMHMEEHLTPSAPDFVQEDDDFSSPQNDTLLLENGWRQV